MSTEQPKETGRTLWDFLTALSGRRKALYWSNAVAWLLLIGAIATLSSGYVTLQFRGQSGPVPNVGAPVTSKTWVSIDIAKPKFPATDCPARLPVSLNIASAANVQPARWGDQSGLWFGELHENTVWLACTQIGAAPVVIVGAAGPASESTKSAVDLLVNLISK